MSRFPLVLAALADAAIPGLRPAWVEEVVDRVGEHFRVGFVEDEAGRRWVVRVPADAVAAAQQDETTQLLKLLGRRLPFSVPQPVGFAPLRDGRRAMVYPLIPGRTIRFATLPDGPGLAHTFAEAVAALHDTDRLLFEEADVPSYDAQDCRVRRQVDLDRGAQTGLVPTGLLNRWERMLDDVSWWRFAPTPVHGHLDETHVLCEFDDERDAGTGRVSGMTSWEWAQIGDPAEDFAALVGSAHPDTVRCVFDAYSRARHEPPDAHLLERARLLRELRVLSDLLTARNLGDRSHVAEATRALRRLDDEVSEAGTSGNRGGTIVDRLPVDYDPTPSDESWYKAGSPADTSTARVVREESAEAGVGGARPRPDAGDTASTPGPARRADSTNPGHDTDVTGERGRGERGHDDAVETAARADRDTGVRGRRDVADVDLFD